jgi:restriction endonuclease S subunit
MINKSKLESLSFPIAPLPLQQKFAKSIEKIETQKALYEQELKAFESLFDSLLSESFA